MNEVMGFLFDLFAGLLLEIYSNYELYLSDGGDIWHNALPLTSSATGCALWSCTDGCYTYFIFIFTHLWHIKLY